MPASQHPDGCPVTPRQLEAYEHLIAGHAATTAANQMRISHQQYRALLREGRRRLGAADNAHAAQALVDAGWATGNPPTSPIATELADNLRQPRGKRDENQLRDLTQRAIDELLDD